MSPTKLFPHCGYSTGNSHMHFTQCNFNTNCNMLKACNIVIGTQNLNAHSQQSTWVVALQK